MTKLNMKYMAVGTTQKAISMRVSSKENIEIEVERVPNQRDNERHLQKNLDFVIQGATKKDGGKASFYCQFSEEQAKKLVTTLKKLIDFRRGTNEPEANNQKTPLR